MASFMFEMAIEPSTELRSRGSDWDMSVYDDIEDFQCTSDWYSAKRGLASFA